VSRARLAALIVLAAGLAFGFMGGEYSTLDWWQLRRSVSAEQAALNRLYVELDSLSVVAEALETDSTTQERVARERFGMIRDGEALYKVVP